MPDWLNSNDILTKLTCQTKRLLELTNICGHYNKRPRLHQSGLGLLYAYSGGGSGIRTHDRVAPITVFKTVAFVRSAIPPLSAEPGMAAGGPVIYCNHY